MSETLARNLAAEAMAAYVEQDEWQLGEIRTAMGELDTGKGVSHDRVTSWLKSWGKVNEKKAPR